MCLLLLFLLDPSCSTIKSGTTGVNRVIPSQSSIDRILLGSTQDDVIKVMGQPTQTGVDQKNNILIFRYSFERNGKTLPRFQFIFSKKENKLTAKYKDIYKDDPESSIEFWKSKYSSKDLTLKSKQIIDGHSITTRYFIDLDPTTSLEVEKNQVVMIFWNQ
jgi:hypothetical protein